jgi:Na+/H+ antiporter NhaC
MGRFEAIARDTRPVIGQDENGSSTPAGPGSDAGGHWAVAVVPIVVLITTLMGGIYLGAGVGEAWPVTRDKVVVAFGGSHVVIALVCASVVGALAAFILFPRRGTGNRERASTVFQNGVQSLFIPITILLGAWVLGSTLADLKAAAVISEILSGRLPVGLFPVAVFLTGAAISFTTGTSWGTMGILMPLAVPVVLSLGGGGSEDTLLAAVVGAVFSGAVFGDHCSPISDTTIVSSIACEVSAHDHVRTQLPFALIAGGAAVVLGFLPAGMSVSVWVSLAMGAVFIWVLPGFLKRTR